MCSGSFRSAPTPPVPNSSLKANQGQLKSEGIYVKTPDRFPDTAKDPRLLLSNVAGSGPRSFWLDYSPH